MVCSKGSQEPTRSVVPDFAETEWRNVHDINAQGGIEMLEWQDLAMEAWTARTRLGRWAAPVCGLSVPRQNGKTLGVTEPRCNWGMLKLGEQVIYTSHLQKTSTETFEDMAEFFDSPSMRKYVKAVKTAIGREQIVLKERRTKKGAYVPGGRIKFLARTRNGGRGQHGDLLVFDEALELSAESQASFLPAISASKNPQTIYTSTPPSIGSESSVFRGIRDSALSGESGRVAWHEWSVGEVGDVHDKRRWYATNPSLGILINEDTVEGECDQMDELTFAIERLGYWYPLAKAETAIDPAVWKSSAVGSIADVKAARQAFGIKFSPDGASYALAGAIVDKDGNVYAEIADSGNTGAGMRQIARDLMGVRGDACCVMVDGQNEADALCDRMAEEGATRGYVVRAKASDVIAAAGLLVDGLKDGSVLHTSNEGQAALDSSAASAARRQIGRSGWGFGGDSTPLEALALAVYAVKNSKRNPKRRQVIL